MGGVLVWMPTETVGSLTLAPAFRRVSTLLKGYGRSVATDSEVFAFYSGIASRLVPAETKDCLISLYHFWTAIGNDMPCWYPKTLISAP